jgi:purine-nucleoside phosphorylase
MPEMDTYRKKVEEAAEFLAAKCTTPPAVVIILGTGLGSLVDAIETETILPYVEIPHFPRATAPGHPGNLVLGTLSRTKVAVLQGRLHYYEGYSTRELTFPLRVLSRLGPGTLIITNVAGGLAPHYSPGTIMVMEDHLNFIGENPLRGANVDAWGPRFPDMAAPYDRELIDTTLQCAARLHLPAVETGVYVAIPGPSLETPAETRFLRGVGAHAVGMSSVPEVIVARHASMQVLGLSAIVNVNDPDNFAPILLDDVLAAAAAIEPAMARLIMAVLGDPSFRARS